MDLDDRPLPDLAWIGVNVAVFGGVFEYLHRFEDIPPWLAQQVLKCIASYECACPLGDLPTPSRNAARLRNGWVTTYTEDELVSLFETAGWRCSDRRTWTTADGHERIFVFERDERSFDR